ncbi:MAG: porin family protein [Proteobacteria bacterium]|nr:porin family protein [Pseudomonadota bacterium]
MKKYLLATLFTLGSAAAAHSQDSVVLQGNGAYNWSGVYAGVAVGHAWGDSPFRNTEDDWIEATDYEPNGAFGGIYLGYNHQLSNGLVLGVDADINAANLKGGGNPYVWGNGEPTEEVDWVESSSRMNWNGAIRARLGYAIDRFMPYVAGGVSVGRYSFDLKNRGDGEILFSEKDTMVGWNIGAGIEYAATDNLILRAEYRFSDYGNKGYHDLWGVDDARIKLQTHDIRLGVAYKF